MGYPWKKAKEAESGSHPGDFATLNNSLTQKQKKSKISWAGHFRLIIELIRGSYRIDVTRGFTGLSVASPSWHVLCIKNQDTL